MTAPALCPECGETAGHPPFCKGRLRELAGKATPGPWYARGRFLSRVPDSSGMGGTLETNHLGVFARDDCEYVAAADPTTILALLDECAALRARIAELEAQHDGNGDAFASGRRYERTYAGLRVRALEQVIDRVRALAAEAHDPERYNWAAYEMADCILAELPPEVSP